MARKKARQLRLFGVGNLDSSDGGEGSADTGGDSDERWDKVYENLLRLLQEEGYGDFLARRSREGGSSGGP